MSVPKIFEIFSKVTGKVSIFGKFYNVPWYLVSSNSSGNFLLSGVIGLTSTGCSVTKNRLLTKLLKCVLKISKNVQPDVCNRTRFT